MSAATYAAETAVRPTISCAHIATGFSVRRTGILDTTAGCGHDNIRFTHAVGYRGRETVCLRLSYMQQENGYEHRYAFLYVLL